MLRSCMRLRAPLSGRQNSAAFAETRAATTNIYRPQSTPARYSGRRTVAAAAVHLEQPANEPEAKPQRQDVTVYFSGDGVYTTAQPGENLWAVSMHQATVAEVENPRRCGHAGLSRLTLGCMHRRWPASAASQSPRCATAGPAGHVRCADGSGGLTLRAACLCGQLGDIRHFKAGKFRVLHRLAVDGGAQVG